MLRATGRILKDIWGGYQNHRVPRMGAALAFYTALAMAPLMSITLRVAGAIFGAEDARDALVEQAAILVGPEGAAAVGQVAEYATNWSRSGWALTLEIALLFLTASGVFLELQDSLNVIWGVEVRPHGGVVSLLLDRLLSFSMVLVLIFLLMVSLAIDAALAAFSRVSWGDAGPLGYGLDLALSFLVVTVLFALLFKILPDVRLRWTDVWLGTALTAGLFLVGKFLIGLYLANSQLGSRYGGLASLVALLLWVYYTGQIFFLGAEFMRALARDRGAKIAPESHAGPAPVSDPAAASPVGG